MGQIGVNISGWNPWDTGHGFTNLCRHTAGVRQQVGNLWLEHSGTVEFDPDGMILFIPGGTRAAIVVYFEDGDEGRWEINYAGKRFDDVTPVGLRQDGTAWNAEAGNKAFIWLNLGAYPSLFSCTRVGEVNSSEWNSRYLNSFANYSVVRWLDPLGTNLDKVSEEKPKHMESFYGDNFGSREPNWGVDASCIDRFAKATDTTPWICLHHSWSPEYCADFVQSLEGFAIVEPGNEFWNGSKNSHARWAQQGANNDGSNTEALLWGVEHMIPQLEAVADRGYTIVLPTREPGDSGQMGTTHRIMDHMDSLGTLDLFDGIAAAPYVRIDDGGDTETNLRMLDEAVDRKIELVARQYSLAKDHGLEYYLYECGYEIFWGKSSQDSVNALMRSGRMVEITEKLVRGYMKYSDIACWFADVSKPRNGTAFGLRESIAQPFHAVSGPGGSPPKVVGLLQALELDPIPDPGPAPVPVPVPQPVQRLHTDDLAAIIDAVRKVPTMTVDALCQRLNSH